MQEFALSELICQMEVLDGDRKNRRESFDNNGRPKSPHTVESLLLLDNSLLYDVEPDNGLHIPSETNEPFQELDDSVVQASKRQRNDAKVSSKVSFSASSNVNEWQDKTLMNQVFAQFDSQNAEEIVSENCNNISDFDMFDTFCKEDMNSELGQNVEEASLSQRKSLHKNLSYQDELMNVSCLHITNFGDTVLKNSPVKKNDIGEGSPILKAKPRILNECKIAKKKFRLNNAVSVSKKVENEIGSTNRSSFYDLPDTVEKLIQEVKGICELYRKFVNQVLQIKFRNKYDLYCFFLYRMAR